MRSLSGQSNVVNFNFEQIGNYKYFKLTIRPPHQGKTLKLVIGCVAFEICELGSIQNTPAPQCIVKNRVLCLSPAYFILF